jgi:hypothetical protein
LLTLVAASRPTVFWIEDIQWADHSTLEFLPPPQCTWPYSGPDGDRHNANRHRRTCRSRVGRSSRRHQRGENRAPEADLGGIEAAESPAVRERRSTKAWRPRSWRAPAASPCTLRRSFDSAVSSGQAHTRLPAIRPARRSPFPRVFKPIFAQIVDRLGSDRQIAQMHRSWARARPEPLTASVTLCDSELDRGLSDAAVSDVSSYAEIIEADRSLDAQPRLPFRSELIPRSAGALRGRDGRERQPRP